MPQRGSFGERDDWLAVAARAEPGSPRRRKFHLAELYPRFYLRFYPATELGTRQQPCVGDIWRSLPSCVCEVANQGYGSRQNVQGERRAGAGASCTYCGRTFNDSGGDVGKPNVHFINPVRPRKVVARRPTYGAGTTPRECSRSLAALRHAPLRVAGEIPTSSSGGASARAAHAPVWGEVFSGARYPAASSSCGG